MGEERLNEQMMDEWLMTEKMRRWRMMGDIQRMDRWPLDG